MFEKSFFIMCFMIALSGAQVPITPCKVSDKDCVNKSAQELLPYFIAGIPELGIKSVESVPVSDYDTTFGDLKISLSDMTAYEIPNAQLVNVEYNSEKPELVINLITPIKIVGKYKITGEFLKIPVEGAGDMELSSNKVSLTATGILKEVTKDGKEYKQLTKADFKYKFEEKLVIYLTNLYGGDKEKGDVLLKALNDSWEILVDGIGEPLVKDIINTIIKTSIKPFFDKISSDKYEQKE